MFATVTDGTPGVYELWRATGNATYAKVAATAGAWMLDHMKVPSEWMFYDCVNATTGHVYTTKSPIFPGPPPQPLNQVARPNNEGYMFLDMYSFTGPHTLGCGGVTKIEN